MAKKINFKDNLFHLARSLDRFSDGLTLDLEGDFFLDKFVDDILFFNSVISRIYAILEKNSNMSEYREQMRNLYTVQKKYITILNRIISGQICFADQFARFGPKFSEILRANEVMQNQIYASLDTAAKTPQEANDVVSRDEMSALLQF
ncbi:MAG: hypothetical protein LBR47_02015 [Spirochaetaceae bacterium]|jgi:hypothetical protein|nr:hypothetical protein [Spirochaetaceae bacterium]